MYIIIFFHELNFDLNELYFFYSVFVQIKSIIFYIIYLQVVLYYIGISTFLFTLKEYTIAIILRHIQHF